MKNSLPIGEICFISIGQNPQNQNITDIVIHSNKIRETKELLDNEVINLLIVDNSETDMRIREKTVTQFISEMIKYV